MTVDGSDGRPVDWHVLDTGPGPAGTVVCVHGNPSWGYIWRDLLTTLSPDWRVIAVDQTGMGWSERGRPRRLADRVAELVVLLPPGGRTGPSSWPPTTGADRWP